MCRGISHAQPSGTPTCCAMKQSSNDSKVSSCLGTPRGSLRLKRSCCEKRGSRRTMRKRKNFIRGRKLSTKSNRSIIYLHIRLREAGYCRGAPWLFCLQGDFVNKMQVRISCQLGLINTTCVKLSPQNIPHSLWNTDFPAVAPTPNTCSYSL